MVGRSRLLGSLRAVPALDDVKVIDIATVFAGPGAARHLADFGADVVKVEAPAGDGVRRMGWFPPEGGDSYTWKLLGRNKRAVVLDLKAGDGGRSVSLEEFTAVTGFHFTPMATISLLVNGQKRRTSETGVGPIDAALKAIRTAVSQSIRLEEFRLDAITGGADSLCQVTVRLADPEPVPVSALGRAVGPDIVTTSVDAAVEALNRLLRAQAQMPRQPRP